MPFHGWASWDRSIWHNYSTIPVGLCVNEPLVSTCSTFCPPAPTRSGSVKLDGLQDWCQSPMVSSDFWVGIHEAKEVNVFFSRIKKGEIRTSRWTPVSDFKKTESQGSPQIPKYKIWSPATSPCLYVYFFDFVAIFLPPTWYTCPHEDRSPTRYFCSAGTWLNLKNVHSTGLPQTKSIFFEFNLFYRRLGFSCIPLWFHLQWLRQHLLKLYNTSRSWMIWSLSFQKQTRPSPFGPELFHCCFLASSGSFQNSGWARKWPFKVFRFSYFLTIVVKDTSPKPMLRAFKSFQLLPEVICLRLKI